MIKYLPKKPLEEYGGISPAISQMILVSDLVSVAGDWCINAQKEFWLGDPEMETSVMELIRTSHRINRILKRGCGRDISNLSGTTLDKFIVEVKRIKEN